MVSEEAISMAQGVNDEIAEIVERLQGQEELDWEVKAAAGGIPNAIWETVSAFANTHGGWLILGIAERNGQQVIEGVSNPEMMIRQLHDQLRNAAKISYTVCGAQDIHLIAQEEKRVIALRIPPAPRRVRPVYTKGNPYAGTYVRRNEGDYPATRPEVDRMMSEASDVSGDQVILTGYAWDDFDEATFQGYRRRFQTANPDSPHNALSDIEFLSAIGGHRRDRETGQSGMTVAGLLMFGKEEPIRAWRGRHIIDYRRVSGDPTQTQADWIDRLVWEGNLLGAFDGIYRRLIDGLPRPFAVVDGVRVDQNDHHVAIREAFVNLLLHADYSEQASSLIISSAEGFFFRNPGSSRIPDLSPYQGDRSDPRNPALVRMFRLIGLAEEAGSGIPRIFQAWRTLGYESPSFDVGGSQYEFSAELLFTHLLSDADRSWIEAIGLPLSEEQQLAIVIARHEGWVDNVTLRELTGRHPADVTRILGDLRDSGLLRMTGGGRGARYQLDPATLLIAESEPQTATLPQISHASTAPVELSTTDIATNTSGLPESSASPAQDLMDDPHWIELNDIASPVASVDYLPSKERDDTIIALCHIRPLSLLELVWLLGRNKAYLRSVLKNLVDLQRLEYEYPDRPRHPHQRYRARN